MTYQLFGIDPFLCEVEVPHSCGHADFVTFEFAILPDNGELEANVKALFDTPCVECEAK